MFHAADSFVSYLCSGRPVLGVAHLVDSAAQGKRRSCCSQPLVLFSVSVLAVQPVRPYALAIWTLTMTLLTVLLCIFTGLGGFVGITGAFTVLSNRVFVRCCTDRGGSVLRLCAVIMGCYCCIINMVYCCIRVRRKVSRASAVRCILMPLTLAARGVQAAMHKGVSVDAENKNGDAKAVR